MSKRTNELTKSGMIDASRCTGLNTATPLCTGAPVAMRLEKYAGEKSPLRNRSCCILAMYSGGAETELM